MKRTIVLAWMLWLATLALTVVFLALEARYGAGATAGRMPEVIAVAALLVGTASLGLLIVVRAANAIGWLFCLIALSNALGGVTNPALTLRLVPAVESTVVLTTWVGSALWLPGLLLLPLIVLLFPDGHLPSSRWRPVLWLGAAGMTVGVAGILLQPELFGSDEALGRPIQAPLAGVVSDSTRQLLDVVLLALLTPCLGAALASPVVRYRRARSVERAQLRWFAWGAAVTVAGEIVFNVLWWEQTPVLLSVLMGMALPTSVTIAILRYRLYDIDVIIRRTLVYAVLTAALAVIYGAGVVSVSAITGRLSTQGSDLPIAVATLMVAGLFAPLRGRIQAQIDQRFYRSRYDAQRAVDAFALRMRDQADLEILRMGLVDAVTTTIHPLTVWLWVKPASSRPGSPWVAHVDDAAASSHRNAAVAARGHSPAMSVQVGTRSW